MKKEKGYASWHWVMLVILGCGSEPPVETAARDDGNRMPTTSPDAGTTPPDAGTTSPDAGLTPSVECTAWRDERWILKCHEQSTGVPDGLMRHCLASCQGDTITIYDPHPNPLNVLPADAEIGIYYEFAPPPDANAVTTTGPVAAISVFAAPNRVDRVSDILPEDSQANRVNATAHLLAGGGFLVRPARVPGPTQMAVVLNYRLLIPGRTTFDGYHSRFYIGGTPP